MGWVVRGGRDAVWVGREGEKMKMQGANNEKRSCSGPSLILHLALYSIHSPSKPSSSPNRIKFLFCATY